MSDLLESLRQEFQNEDARYAYAENFLNAYVAAQIKTLRDQRGMSQQEMADAIGTKQSGISRLENVNYSAWKVETLRKLARAFGLWLHISFEEFGNLPRHIEGFTKRNLQRRKFADDPVFASAPAENENATGKTMPLGAVAPVSGDLPTGEPTPTNSSVARRSPTRADEALPMKSDRSAEVYAYGRA